MNQQQILKSKQITKTGKFTLYAITDYRQTFLIRDDVQVNLLIRDGML